MGASDIHFDPTDEGITVRLRTDGILNDYFLLKNCIKIDKNMKFYVFCFKKNSQKSAKNSHFFSLIFMPKSRQI